MKKEEQNQRPQPFKKQVKRYNLFMRYISVSMEMIVTLLLCAWAGRALDDWQQTDKPYYTIGLTLFGLFASMYQLLKGLSNINRDKNKPPSPKK
ncbi:AtpZ/AtpI family protein [Algivirga pacifica]|uniref:F0F1-ATPase subunit Ca2+/Mg2+ transporter n=1 Tax=Algivirga pacifica TaxID=1162670 RepID=A0ABP9DJY1_9BACT